MRGMPGANPRFFAAGARSALAAPITRRCSGPCCAELIGGQHTALARPAMIRYHPRACRSLGQAFARVFSRTKLSAVF